jgi:AcrR family transcriptional regulator
VAHASGGKPPADRPTAPLGRQDWLEAGQRLLRTSGVGGLKLRALADSLGISTGSFYHHFRDFDAYLVALAKYYSGEQLAANIATVMREAHTPYDRIVRASALARETSLPELITAMRAWARRDPRVAPEVAVLEQGLMDFLAQCFVGLGFTQAQAVTRAFVMLSAASSEVALPGSGDKGQFGRAIIDLVCAGSPRRNEKEFPGHNT